MSASGPILDAMGTRVIHCGASGAGQVTKACNQLIVMSTTVAVAETLRLAEHAGVDPWTVREALMGGYAASPMLDIQGPKVLDETYQPGGKAIFHAKDIATIRELKAAAGLDLPLFDAVARPVRAAVRDPGRRRPGPQRRRHALPARDRRPSVTDPAGRPHAPRARRAPRRSS